MESGTATELDAQYRVLREGAGAFERADRRLISVAGSEAAEYLQGQLTNEVEALAPGEGVYTALLDRKGHLQGDMRTLRTADGFEIDTEAIAGALKRLADQERVRFVFTTGGTGLTIDDVTPEATRDVIEREAPGYAEAIRADSRRHTPLGILTRGVSGVRGRTLILNFPGNPKAIEQSWPLVEPTLEHAAATLERGV